MARPQPATMSHSAYLDPFARDHLPPADTWPEIDLSHPNYAYPERLNAAAELLDRWIETGHGAARCLIGAGETWSYRDLQARVNSIANDSAGNSSTRVGRRARTVALRKPPMRG